MEIYERTNNTGGQVICLDDLARSLYYDGQTDAAEEAASRAIGLAPEKGQEYFLCKLHRSLGMIHQSKGEKAKAIHHFKTALSIASTFNWQDVLFSNNHDLADLFLSEGEFEEATAHIDQALPYATDGSHRLGCAKYIQARIWSSQRALEEAKTGAMCALEIFEKLGATKDAGNCRNLLHKIERKMLTSSRSTSS